MRLGCYANGFRFGSHLYICVIINLNQKYVLELLFLQSTAYVFAILLLFENDDQRKKNFLVSYTILKLWPVEIFTTRWRFTMRAHFVCS